MEIVRVFSCALTFGKHFSNFSDLDYPDMPTEFHLNSGLCLVANCMS